METDGGEGERRGALEQGEARGDASESEEIRIKRMGVQSPEERSCAAEPRARHQRAELSREGLGQGQEEVRRRVDGGLTGRR